MIKVALDDETILRLAGVAAGTSSIDLCVDDATFGALNRIARALESISDVLAQVAR